MFVAVTFMARKNGKQSEYPQENDLGREGKRGEIQANEQDTCLVEKNEIAWYILTWKDVSDFK